MTMKRHVFLYASAALMLLFAHAEVLGRILPPRIGYH
jgi:hypothetical protein